MRSKNLFKTREQIVNILKGLKYYIEQRDINPDITENKKKAIASIVVLTAILVLTHLIISPQAQSSIHLVDNATVDQIESNHIGSIILTNNRVIPLTHKHSDIKICIYTSADEKPILTSANLKEQIYLKGGQVTSTDITFDIPEEALSNPDLEGEYPVELIDKCPIRTDRKIVVQSN